MEINEQVLNDLADLVMSTFENTKLTSKGLTEAQAHTQEMFQKVKEILAKLAEQNPEFTQEQLVEAASNRVEEMDRTQDEKSAEKPTLDEEPKKDDNDMEI